MAVSGGASDAAGDGARTAGDGPVAEQHAAAVSTSASIRVIALLTVANGFLDAYTFLAHDRVFANAQTGNIVLFAVGLARHDVADPSAHVWPILAFVLGIAAGWALKTPSAEVRVRHPQQLALTAQVIVLAVVALLPAATPQWTITTSISFLSALQLSLFRTVRTAPYVTIAMTGNLMRITESLQSAARGHHADRRLAALYLALAGAFAAAAVAGALITTQLHTTAAWIPATLIAAAAAQYLVDDRRVGRVR